MKHPKEWKECACCGQYAGRFHQWHNRDNGYGVCPSCAKEELETMGEKYVTECYGKPGVHFSYDPNKMELEET